jgi:hypothetical protein
MPLLTVGRTVHRNTAPIRRCTTASIAGGRAEFGRKSSTWRHDRQQEVALDGTHVKAAPLRWRRKRGPRNRRSLPFFQSRITWRSRPKRCGPHEQRGYILRDRRRRSSIPCIAMTRSGCRRPAGDSETSGQPERIVQDETQDSRVGRWRGPGFV